MENTLEKELRASLVDGYLPCPAAFEVAEKRRVARREVGDAANRLGIRVSNCQLGCFVIEKAAPSEKQDVNERVAERIKASLVDGRLPCASALKASKQLEVSPKQVRNAADNLHIKISSCQLGCFK